MPIGLLCVDDPDVGAMRRYRSELLAGERAGDRGDAGPRDEIVAYIPAQHPEGQVGRARCVRGRHPRVRVLLQLERRRPAVLDCVAQTVQRADPRVTRPAEHELPGCAHPDQLVVDDIGRHPHERQVAQALPDQLVPGGVRDQVREALERDGVSVVHELAHRVGKRDGVCHRFRTGRGGPCRPAR